MPRLLCFFVLAGMGLGVVGGACDEQDPARPGREGPGSILALVAASAKDAVEECAALFEKEDGTRVKVSPGPSNTLAVQVLEGAPADIFLSASDEWAAAVEKKGLALEAKRLLGNTLVLVVPQRNPAGVKSPADLSSPALRKLALAGENVPAGKYAGQALKALGILSTLEEGKKIARGQDVRSALAYVERGEADAAIVYATDARVSKAVETAHVFDPKTHDAISYRLILLESSGRNPAARRFFEFLGSGQAGEVFQHHGFPPP